MPRCCVLQRGIFPTEDSAGVCGINVFEHFTIVNEHAKNSTKSASLHTCVTPSQH